MSRKILIVDDDRNILLGYQRVLGRDHQLETCLGGAEALERLSGHGPYAVLVADMQMPGMNGLELLKEVERRHPEVIRIMLTGNPDQQTAVDAVNEGHVFRFLTKPCTPMAMDLALRAGLRQHALEHAERELLDHTLTGALEVLTELLSSVDPVGFGPALVNRRRCGQVARALGSPDVWTVEVAALLAPLGRIALPPELREAVAATPGTQTLLSRVPDVGARLIQAIPRMQGVAEIIRFQARAYDGSDAPAGAPREEALPLGARILKAVSDFTMEEHHRHSRSVAMAELRLRKGAYDPRVLEAMARTFTLLPDPPASPAMMALRDLGPGMVLAEDLRAESGGLVLPQGLRLGAGHLELLRSLPGVMLLQDPVAVLQDGARS